MTTAGPLVYRWVDRAAAASYMRHDAMIGRTRHWLPREVSGLDRLYRKRGLSFATEFGYWMDETLPIGFAVDPETLDNRVVRIDGHAIYLFSDLMDLCRMGFPEGGDLARRRKNAIETSLKSPDEAFVIGDIRNLSSRVREVIVRDDASERSMSSWCRDHAIPMRRH